MPGAPHRFLSGARGMIANMSEKSTELGATGPRETAEEGYVEKSFTGSAQSIGLEPGEDFVPPTMSLDAYEPEADS